MWWWWDVGTLLFRWVRWWLCRCNLTLPLAANAFNALPLPYLANAALPPLAAPAPRALPFTLTPALPAQPPAYLAPAPCTLYPCLLAAFTLRPAQRPLALPCLAPLLPCCPLGAPLPPALPCLPAARPLCPCLLVGGGGIPMLLLVVVVVLLLPPCPCPLPRCLPCPCLFCCPLALALW